jgi:hypothetical protein
MKKLSLVICFILFSSMSHAQFNIDITKTAGGSFDNAITANWSPPSSGATSEAFLTDTSLFQTLFLNNTIGNADIYKAGTANGTWADSSNAHTFSINVVGTPTAHGTKPGPRWRVIKTLANGTTFNGSWFDISSGANSISMTGGTSFNRMVGFQIAGVVNIDSFSHDYGSSTDSLTVSAVPEPSTYALIAGFAAFLFVAIKRRK